MRTVYKYWLEYGLTVAIRSIKQELKDRGQPDFRPGYLTALEDTLKDIKAGATSIVEHDR
jgi:hypothetical protein